MTDCELRELVSTSQEEGFKALFQQYQSYVYTIVWNQLRIVGTAEECIHHLLSFRIAIIIPQISSLCKRFC